MRYWADCSSIFYPLANNNKLPCKKSLASLSISSKSGIDKSVQSCSKEMEQLINEIKVKFYNARIFVTGYYTAFDTNGLNVIDNTLVSSALTILTHGFIQPPISLVAVPFIWKDIADKNIFFVNDVAKYFTSFISRNTM
jgi:hypothetical protein